MKYQLFSNQENGFLAFIYIESISYLNYWQKLYHCSFNKSKKDVSLFSSHDHIKKCRTSLVGVILIIYTPDLAPKMFVLTNFALLFFEFLLLHKTFQIWYTIFTSLLLLALHVNLQATDFLEHKVNDTIFCALWSEQDQYYHTSNKPPIQTQRQVFHLTSLNSLHNLLEHVTTKMFWWPQFSSSVEHDQSQPNDWNLTAFNQIL